GAGSRVNGTQSTVKSVGVANGADGDLLDHSVGDLEQLRHPVELAGEDDAVLEHAVDMAPNTVDGTHHPVDRHQVWDCCHQQNDQKPYCEKPSWTTHGPSLFSWPTPRRLCKRTRAALPLLVNPYFLPHLTRF